MTFFKTLLRATRQALFGSRTRPPANRARLNLEALEAREVPAVGKWLPPPTPSQTELSVNYALTQPVPIPQPASADLAAAWSDALFRFDGAEIFVPTETGNP